MANQNFQPRPTFGWGLFADRPPVATINEAGYQYLAYDPLGVDPVLPTLYETAITAGVAAYFAVGGTGSTPPEATSFYVDPGTFVAVADQDGSIVRPYSTLQAALNRCAFFTTIAAGSNSAVLPQGTINVASTALFPAKGSLQIATTTGPQNGTVQYSSKNATQFLGVTGGTGTMTTGIRVSPVGFAIYIAAGTLTENVVIPQVDRLSIIGSGIGTTVIANPPGTAGDTVSFVRDTTDLDIAFFTMSNMFITNDSNTAANTGLRIDGNAETTARFGRLLFLLDNIRIGRKGAPGATGSGMFIRRVGKLATRSCKFIAQGNTGCVVSVNNGSNIEFNGTEMNNLTLTYDTANATPVGGRAVYRLTNYTEVNGTGTVTLTGHPIVFVSKESMIVCAGGLQGVALSTAATGFAPVLFFYGLSTNAGGNPGGIVLPLPATTATEIPYVDFSGATIEPGFGFSTLPYVNITSAGGTSVQQIYAQGAQFNLYATGGLTPALSAIALASNTSWNVNGAFYPGQTTFPSAGPGTLDRDSWAIYGQVNTAGAVAIAPAYPVGTTAYVVSAMPSATGVSVGIAPGAKTASAFTFTNGGNTAATIDFLLTRVPT